MTLDIPPSSIHRSFLAGILLCLVVIGYSLLRYPAILIPLRTALLFAGILLVVVLSYVIVIWRLSRFHTAEALWSARSGLGWGCLISILWLAEITTGNLANSGNTVVQLTYFGTSATALFLPLLTGFWGARHSGSFQTGTLVGLYSGLVSGLLTFFILMAVTYLFLPTFLQDRQNVLQFQASGASDLTAFVIGDSLAGGIGHLLLGLVLGTGLGAVGALVGKAFTHENRSTSQPNSN